MKVALNDNDEIEGIEVGDEEIIENIISIVSMKTNKDLSHKKVQAEWVVNDEIILKIKIGNNPKKGDG